MPIKRNSDISIAFKKVSHGTKLGFETRDYAEIIKCCSQFEENIYTDTINQKAKIGGEKFKTLQAPNFIKKALTVLNSENKKESRSQKDLNEHKKSDSLLRSSDEQH